MDFTKEQIKAAFQKIPSDIRDIIASVDKADALYAILEKYKLHVDKVGELGKQVDFVLIGLLHPSKFTESIQKKLEVSEADARAIAQDVNEKIFRPVRESLKKLHGIADGVDPTPTSTASVITPKPPASPTSPLIPSTPTPIPTPAPKPISPPVIAPLTPQVQKTPPVPASFTPRFIPPTPQTPAPPLPHEEKLGVNGSPAQPKAAWGQYVEPTPAVKPAPAEKPPTPNNIAEEPVENREKVLQEIEHPTPTIPTDIAHEKLSGTMQLPKQEIDVSGKIGAATLENKPEIPPKYKTDPYREPIE